MAKIQKKPTRGGTRPGSGRPALSDKEKKLRMNFMISPSVAARLDQEGNKSDVVDQALKRFYEIETD